VKALTVQQPWAWAIAHAGKTVENRATYFSHRGPLAVHAGAAWSFRGMRDQRVRDVWNAAGKPTTREENHPDRQWELGRWTFNLPSRKAVPFGALIAVAELVDVHPDGDCCRPWGESSYTEGGGRVRTGIHHLVLEDIRALPEPVPCRGQLGMWTVPEDLSDLVTKLLTKEAS
jgi:hypothetical protein